ncbi:5-formyltetrahydrofolate cyclo-ligase [Erwinia sp. OLTSP20]|uniref:5-formyltetrahydrofolate cyclo-ligase n=1 Tax=unclassified Erwinia TaxID=2622719 RepID=UPI000C179DDC|nr:MULTISPECIES: 5-formyltetrahydrofolate cyclo-ligase [unclassified Erwinia]PIJ48986.1 5-formyltetrahydrofolate cyclo-ligase [Erwinia sp. OAMSP11]PIJ74639.1 5-formyltetrahydrofolate cyclo-ligase [Erwinia sp. OLSSP12]PIJ79670.1 5-formyltetrahydrofolate cyclo-ligase [Erwinia sp. OLCASP19]PIJ80455.1 5-formyltetrahydrofolate cyclo-ligase [Erwinia sp. OLMTSP26]PIJ82570.1 5-formyltetrahydrofolate cyclo-ligase [Erwinia sp. OLMDSP33]
MSVSLHDRQAMRTHIRHLRRALGDEQQQKAAERTAEHAMALPQVQQARHVAVFLPVDGELNTRPLIARLWHQKKQVYLPVLHPFSPGQLLFIHYELATPLQLNRLRIPEPPLDVRHLLPLDKLDVLFVPLVAFDSRGQRLGMGGGFYDRTLQNWQQHGFFPVGLAHDCQHVKRLPSASWDIPLPAVITPAKLWQWQQNAEGETPPECP